MPKRKTVAFVNQGIKRKRGRPRKNLLPASGPADVIQITASEPFRVTAEAPPPEPPRWPPSGDLELPAPEDAVKVLAELATLNDQAIDAQKKYLDLKEKTKIAREKFDQLAAMVLTRLRVTTHKTDLPLFSEQREADLTRMVEASQDAPDAPRNDEPEAGGVLPSLPGSDAPPGAAPIEDSRIF